MLQDFEEDLAALGLTRNEARIYLALCQSGAGTASEIASRTGLYRPYVYDTLNKLIKKGLASFVVSDGKKRFRAADPGRFEDLLEEKKERLERVLSRLHRQLEHAADAASVEVYQGKTATSRIFKEILEVLKRTRVEHLGIGIDEELFLKEKPFFSGWFISQLERHKLKERMITFEGAVHFAGGKTTEYRFVPKELFNPTATLIDGDMVSIIFWTHPNIVIKIVSRELADAYRKQFELLWNLGKAGRWRKTSLSSLSGK